MFKTSFYEEDYLGAINRKDHRSAFTKLRLSAHKLEIEMGRYTSMKNRKKPQDRICKFCKIECEDEEHIVVTCPLYEDFRVDLYSEISKKYEFFKTYNKSMKFIWLMSNVDPVIMSLVSQYIFKCFSKRSK